MTESLGKAYKPWIVASIAILVFSLFLLAADVTAGFLHFGEETPVWIIILGVLAVLGIILGFTGFLGLMLFAGYKSLRDEKKIEVLPPQ